MPKKSKVSAKKFVRHDHLAIAALAFVGIATFVGVDAFSSPEAKTIAHANTSANPYQPVNVYSPRTQSFHDTRLPAQRSSPSSSLPSTTTLRRVIVLERSVKTIGRQLQRVENRIDALSAALEFSETKQLLSLHSSIEDLIALQVRLEQRLVEVSTKLESYRLEQ